MKAMITAIILSVCLVTGVGAAEFSADMVMKVFGSNDAGKVYYKNQDLTRSDAMGMIIITKRPMFYKLFSDTKKYVVTDLAEIAKSNPTADSANFLEWMKKNNFKKVGTETFQGYDCDIYEGDVIIDKGQPEVHMKAWYAKKLDYPIRNESTMPPPMGTMSTHLENIKIGSQPDHLFEIPAGYVKAKNMQDAMGVGGMGPGSGSAGGGKAPSEAEMKKMKKMMEEMMKKRGKQ